MIDVRELKKERPGQDLPVAHHEENKTSGTHQCGGCTSCHGMTRISASSEGASFADAGAEPAHARRSCATTFFQRNLGNTSLQSRIRSIGAVTPVVQKKCNCGGSCAGCSSGEEELKGVQAKLAIGPVNDVYEREADEVADRVMRMPDPAGFPMDLHEAPETVRRTPDSGYTPADGVGGFRPSVEGGRPLSESTRNFMEPRFGTDLSNVRLHSDEAAQYSASQIHARAYTLGNHISFAKGENESNTSLLAHELTHVVQQGGATPIPPTVQRTVVVNPDTAAADDMLYQFNTICPSVAFTRSGRNIVCQQSSMASRGCECLTDVASDAARMYTINVDTVSDTPLIASLHDGSVDILPNPSSGPRTYGGTNPVVHMPASVGSVMEFGAFSPGGSALWCSNARILGHELCGHGRLNQNCEEKGDRPSHNTTIDTENTIAAEMGEAPRGHYNNRRQGESFHNPVGDRSKVVFKLRNGWHYEAP